jgi:hypothetical protein
MAITKYHIPIADNLNNNLTAAWLKLGVASLVLAGVFSIVLVLSRTPVIQDFIPFTNFFYVALVVHVDLSVLIWLGSFAGVLWSATTRSPINLIDRASISCAVTGTVMITVAPFLGIGNPLMNNYIPILDHPFFIAGLIIFAVGMLLQILRRIAAGVSNFSNPGAADALEFGVYLSAWVALFAILSLITSYLKIPAFYEATGFYELLFWGSGHVLQFTHTALLLVVWIWIASVCGMSIKLSPKVTFWQFVLVLAPTLATVFIYLQFEVVSLEHRMAFTDLMKIGGLASIPLGIIVIAAIFNAERCDDDKRPVKAALYSSIVLFGAGGIIGFMVVANYCIYSVWFGPVDTGFSAKLLRHHNLWTIYRKLLVWG